MQKQGQSSNQIIQDQGAVGNLPQQVIQFFQSRIVTEQNYAKDLLKLNNKFPNIESHPTSCSKVLKHLKAIHSQKYHQTVQFISQIKQEKDNFSTLIAKANEQLQKSANEARIHEINLKNILQKIGKIHLKGEEEIKSIDERFLLKQLSFLSCQYKLKKMQDSMKFLNEQEQICEKLKLQYEGLKTEGQKLVKKIKKHQKVVFETSPQIEKEIIEFVKRYTVQEVSLIRNIQYDIDNMVKKTNIFDDTPTQEKNVKAPKNGTVKIAKDIFKDDFKIKNIFEEVKQKIATCTEETLKQMAIKKPSGQKDQAIEEAVAKWNETKNVDHILVNINSNNEQSKSLANKFIQYFRNKNINKFPIKQLNELQKLFNIIMQTSYDDKNFQNIQELIIYGSCYNSQNEKGGIVTLMDNLGKKQYLSDPYFWRFLLFFAIQRSVIQCFHVENEKKIHIKNSVFSTLVSNSLNMIGCGIDKYGTKNMVAKMGKAFGLEDGQVSDLLKFIETGYDKYEKSKK